MSRSLARFGVPAVALAALTVVILSAAASRPSLADTDANKRGTCCCGENCACPDWCDCDGQSCTNCACANCTCAGCKCDGCPGKAGAVCSEAGACAKKKSCCSKEKTSCCSKDVAQPSTL